MMREGEGPRIRKFVTPPKICKREVEDARRVAASLLTWRALRPFEVVGDVEPELAVLDLFAHVFGLCAERAASGLHGDVERELLAAHEHERVNALVDRALHEGRDESAQERRHPLDVDARDVQLAVERLLVRREAQVNVRRRRAANVLAAHQVVSAAEGERHADLSVLQDDRGLRVAGVRLDDDLILAPARSVRGGRGLAYVFEDRSEQRVEELLVEFDDGRSGRRPSGVGRAHRLALREPGVRRADEEEVRADAAEYDAEYEREYESHPCSPRSLTSRAWASASGPGPRPAAVAG